MIPVYLLNSRFHTKEIFDFLHSHSSKQVNRVLTEQNLSLICGAKFKEMRSIKLSKNFSTRIIHVDKDVSLHRNYCNLCLKPSQKRLNLSLNKKLHQSSQRLSSYDGKDGSNFSLDPDYDNLHTINMPSDQQFDITNDINLTPLTDYIPKVDAPLHEVDEFETIESENLSKISELRKKSTENKEFIPNSEKDLKRLCTLRNGSINLNFNESLTAYISVCAHIGYEDYAFRTFRHCTRRKVPTKSLSLISYNEILKVIAQKPDLNKLQYILNGMNTNNIFPDLNTYAHILTCLGRLVESDASNLHEDSFLKSKNMQADDKNFGQTANKRYSVKRWERTAIKELNDKKIYKAICDNSLNYLKNHDSNENISSKLFEETESPVIVNFIEKTFSEMKNNEITVEEILCNANFSKGGLKYFLKAVEKGLDEKDDITKIFQRCKQSNSSHLYNNPLVNNLNKSVFTKQVQSPAHGVFSSNEVQNRIDEQFEREIDGNIEVPNIYDSSSKNFNQSSQELFDDWKKSWSENLLKAVENHKKFMAENFNSKSFDFDLNPYFQLLSSEEIVQLLIKQTHVLSMGSSYFSPTYNYISLQLGTKFYNKFALHYKEASGGFGNLKDIYQKYCDWFLEPNKSVMSDNSYLPRIQWIKLLQENLHKSNLMDSPPEWPHSLKLSIGKLLMNLILNNALIWVKDDSKPVPAFFKVTRKYVVMVRDELKLSPILSEVINSASMKTLSFESQMMPMMSPPVPWTSINRGAYAILSSEFVRLVSNSHMQAKMMLDGGKQKLFPVMDSLNQLGSIPWKINSTVLDIVIDIFKKGGWEKMDIIPHPESLPRPLKVTLDLPLKERKRLIRENSNYKKTKNEIYSLWCDMLYKLSIANFYRDAVIWLPVNMDFRGRTYPIPPHLTHLSSDIFRSLLFFGQGKKLGEDGLYWLKLHIINLTGFKKRCSLNERLQYFEEIKEEIVDSADRPTDGRKWWTESDEPWQTLAACKEYAAAIRSGQPEEYVSHLPIHQDGSCNGLQHYAALGRDEKGAISVNLTPLETPQDVYSDIVELVEKERVRDAESGLEIAKSLKGIIARKIIKQTVMTNVYGVTKYGARYQILKQMKYLDDFPQDLHYKSSKYLTAKTFKSLGTIFSATKEIQNWLRDLAAGVSKMCRQNVAWETPLGFPVFQPYSKSTGVHSLAGKVSPHFAHELFSTPNVLKQKNGLAPNFVHSLDSCHMMLTSIFSQYAGITFVSIHDCFWTHAATVPVMNKICRKQFVALHKRPILENLAQSFNNNYSKYPGFNTNFIVLNKLSDDEKFASFNDLLKSVPKKGDFDIDNVLNSVFFFS